MKIKKILAVAAVLAMAALGAANTAMTAFAEDSVGLEDVDVGLEEVENEEIRKGEGYYICHVSYRIDPEFYDGNLLFEGTEGRLQEGETRESVENGIIETARAEVSFLSGTDADKYGFDVYFYFYDDYDFTPEEFLDFVSKDILKRDAASEFAENDDIIEEDEAEAIYDVPNKGEGYYLCHISYHGGVPEIYAEDGSVYDLAGEIGGYISEGETRVAIEKEMIESIRNDFVSIGVNPDDYGFDVYLYFYDDYDFTSEEFFDFVYEDILRRDSERDTQTAEVQNPVTGAGLPCTAAVLALLSAAGIFAVNKKKL